MFLSKVYGSAMASSLPALMAQTSLDYADGFTRRCAALSNGDVEPLTPLQANLASLTDLLSSSGNWFAGLENALSTRYSLPAAEPLAKQIVAVWEATASI